LKEKVGEKDWKRDDLLSIARKGRKGGRGEKKGQDIPWPSPTRKKTIALNSTPSISRGEKKQTDDS